jgi:hypothetical protein
VVTEEVSRARDLESLCGELADFMLEAPRQPLVEFAVGDPLDRTNEVVEVMRELSGYNSTRMLHSTYIETRGAYPKEFTRLLGEGPDHIAVKFFVPGTGEGDHTEAESALECLVRSIETPSLRSSERYLIVEISGSSDLEVLGSYFASIAQALSRDARADYARGAALAAFDIVLRPVGCSPEKTLRARELLLGPEYGLSQRVLVDPCREWHDRSTA